ncbi:TonB-dependent receptor [Ferrimonas balearica DSM 9799]|uniref:TonB-dependent receptor n=1 Tax=Ferrimonas balearica (strain DSM 9799 / CCM 4581 / KCTC 23876 / PAT) TaxID=550540 RepID=E1SQ05_FERBD|nr:TonB-dependent receptor [Ferrimonas balearica]ADN75800.1 TonB-dependent receptor [Ferrimonas balearica DSM 9799]
MRRSLLSLAMLAALPVAAEEAMETLTVVADFRGQSLAELPASATVLDAQQLEDEGGEHFEDALHRIPNLNWSGGSSRPRYFQIRGVGEQEEYQGAPNSSVGFIVDDIDLSGIGMAASLFDLSQLEVLRGPQGTRYGANALAGLIYLKSNDPTELFEAGTEISVGEDNQLTVGAYASGAADDNGELLYRVAVQNHQQDGYRYNAYLDRDDTNARDETTVRAKLRWLPTDTFQADLTFLHANLDNGYDVWTLDNNGFTTSTDEPGVDSQRTNGASLKLNWAVSEAVNLTAITSYANSRTQHAYDGDWSNSDYWAGLDCPVYDENWNVVGSEPCVYDYYWDKSAKRDTISQEVRFASGEAGRIFAGTTDWLVGVYYSRLKEHNDLESYYNGFPDQFLISDYKAANTALFGQLDSTLGAWELSAGLRVEYRQSDYADDAGESFDPKETMWGGHLSASRALAEGHRAYVRLARGYKAGGFNMGLPPVLEGQTEFESETLYNYELGLKSRWFDGAVNSNLALFYMDRQNQQVEASLQDPDNPQRFFLYTNNAGASENYGLELDVNWQATRQLEIYGTLGLLKARYNTYLLPEADGSFTDLSGRELAHAPNYQYTLGGTYRADNGWFTNLNLNGVDAFYYSDSHDARSEAYTLVNAKLGYEAQNWALYLWGRNLTDEQYGVRGFYFGNEPNDGWAEKLYVRYGDPRQFGLTFRYDYL